MVFVMGPRQSGKTTVAHNIIDDQKSAQHLSWDNTNDRDLILQGTKAVAESIGITNTLKDVKPIICFDEIHKYVNWRDFIKGFYDSYPDKTRILVTGSAKLDVFSRGGDSLMGRYFPFRFHPLSVSELTHEEFSIETSFDSSISTLLLKIKSLKVNLGTTFFKLTLPSKTLSFPSAPP